MRRAFWAAGLLLVQTACISVSTPSFMRPAPQRHFGGMLMAARAHAANGDFVAADSVLAAFEQAYPRTREGTETLYWRAVSQLDPANGPSGAAVSLPLLQRYLAESPKGAHHTEAAALERVAAQVDLLRRSATDAQLRAIDATRQAANANARAADARTEPRPASPETQALEGEVSRLRSELSKANAELERIKKRLAEPPKKPPTRL